MSSCSPEVCAAFNRSAIDITSKFELCFDTIPSCEDPQIIAFNFYRYGNKNYDLYTQNVDEVLDSLSSLKNATIESAEALYNCSEDANCIFRKTSYTSTKEKLASQSSNSSNTTGSSNNTTKSSNNSTQNETNTTTNESSQQQSSNTFLEMVRPYPESLLQMTVRLIKSIFS
eukprot:TRINITY_DN1191_c0_g2_i5.p1 TRINITY_DN1191_c0_g2~~TRINITY_DN1191_c0_g2_i5.p1  ORF type:complete len:172 (-),score=20.87 TRINITY_DN1191_c0_g2_i5:143-658(-)